MECPICKSKAKCKVDYVPTALYHSLMFMGNKYFCNEFIIFQKELAKYISNRQTRH